MDKIAQTYIIGLIILAFFCLMGAVSILFLALNPPDPHLKSAAWALYFTIFIEVVYVVLFLLALLLFYRNPTTGNVFLTAINILLMLAVPLGTAAGVFYFWKVRNRFRNVPGFEVQ